IASWHGEEPAARLAMQWLGRDAAELRFDNDQSKTSTYERLLVRDGYLYTYQLVPYIGTTPFDEDERAKLWASFTLIDGHVAPRGYDPAPRDTRGSDWRIESRRWESAAV